MFNGSKPKQEAVLREDHVQLAHPLRLPHPQPVATHQLHPLAMKATKRSIYLKQPHRQAVLAEGLEALVEGVLEEWVVPILQA